MYGSQLPRLGMLAALLAVSLFAIPASAQDKPADGLWISPSASGHALVTELAPEAPPRLTVTRSDHTQLDVTATWAGFSLTPRKTKGGQFVDVNWPGASAMGEVGEPGIPVLRRLLLAPQGADVTLVFDAGDPITLDLSALDVPEQLLPVQPPVPKLPGARKAAPFAYDEAAYQRDFDLPTERVTIQEAGIVRDQRLLVLEIRPIAYNPAAKRLTHWPIISASVVFKGGARAAGSLSPLPGLRSAVLNPGLLPPTLRGTGNYLIVVADTYAGDISSFASAKTTQGFTVNAYSVPSGTSNSTIKSYIQGLWGTADAPDYILLVGDTNTIPAWTGGGEATPTTDLPYACMDGSSDWDPDIAIGRFPVRSSAQLAAVVDKTLYVEEGNFADPDYLLRAVFMASNDALYWDVPEGTHNYVIETHMDPNGFTSDKLYCHTYNATTQQVRNAFNAGRLFGIYSGHGGTYSWSDGPPFSQTDVRNLTNGNMYPFVCSFACVTGTYTLTECFTETWILQESKGAVAIYGSSVNSLWDEDDKVERYLFDVIYDDEIREVSPAWQAAMVQLKAFYGATSRVRRYYEMYNLMGDPSLYLPLPGSGSSLQVSPATGLVATGPYGGPFTPDSRVYTLENTRDSSIGFSVSADHGWVAIDDPSGTIPAHDSVDVTVSLGATAANLGTGHHESTVSFVNTTDGDGNTSRMVVLDIGEPTLQYTWDMDTNPGWSTEGLWEWGPPQGQGGEHGGPDPTGGHTGSNVYGYNLNGDYENSLSTRHLVTTPIDCSDLSQVSIVFWRWLGVENSDYDHAYFWVSNNGTDWVELWANTAAVTDSSWNRQEFDISSVADGQSTVHLRWTMGSTDGSWQYCGWNIDDVEIWGVASSGQVPCDFDDDGDVDLVDADAFNDCMAGPDADPDPKNPGATQKECRWEFDADSDDDIDLSDFAVFMEHFTG